MWKTEPHTVVGDLIGRSVETGSVPLSKRALIAAKARNDPKAQFSNLMHHLTYELAEESLMKIPKNSAPGTDGMMAEQARKNLDWILPPLLNQIHRGQYEAPPVRRVYIPKTDGKLRPIGVPEIIDRSLQAGMSQILNEIYEQDFLTCSFGFRPGLGCHNALATISDLVGRHNLNYALEVDIQDFFGSLNHGWLRKFLELRISDVRVLKLIDAWLKAGVIEQGKKEATENGTPQGGSISPLLSNVYLHYVLDLWFERKIKKQLSGRARLVRYCDDFVILFENQVDIGNVKALLKVRLEQFGLTIADTKTHTTDLTPRGNGNGHERRRIAFLGFNIFKARNRKKTGYKTVFQTEGKRFTRAKAAMKEKLHRIMHWQLKDQAKMINSILRGHYNYYGLAGNLDKLQSFCWETTRYWRHCLSKRSQRGKMNWDQIRAVLEQYPLQQPRLKMPYPKIALYARL